MVRRAKLKTRKSTLGATRNERISSAKESLAAISVYAVDNGKKEPKSYNPRTRIARCLMGGQMVEHRDEIVPTSITMDRDDRHEMERFPPPSNRNTTSCSITTRGSLLRDPPPTLSPSSPKRTLNCLRPLVTRAMSRPRSRASSPSKTARTNDTPLSSAILSSNSNKLNKKDYVERVELVSMKNEEDLPFVRIYVSKTSYKPRMGNGTEVIAKPNLTRQAEQRKKRNDWNLARAAEQRNFVNDWNFVRPRDFDQGIVKTARTKEALGSTMTTSPTKRLPPILKTMDTQQLQMCGGTFDHVESAINRVTACHSLDEGPSQPEINPLRRSYSMRRSTSVMANKSNTVSESMSFTPTFGRSIPAFRAGVIEDDINAPNYYGIHSLSNIPNSYVDKSKDFALPYIMSLTIWQHHLLRVFFYVC
jgi:hypothetical protein